MVKEVSTTDYELHILTDKTRKQFPVAANGEIQDDDDELSIGLADQLHNNPQTLNNNSRAL